MIKGTGLPWNTTQNDRNACTNSPGCLVAAKLYQRYEDGNYLSDAKKLYEYVVNNSYNADGRVEEPPLTYTQEHLEKPVANYTISHKKVNTWTKSKTSDQLCRYKRSLLTKWYFT